MASLVLVTGASGFIGSHIVAQLFAAGHHVRATVRNPANAKSVGFLEDLPGSDNLQIVQADLNSEGAFDDHVKGVDFIIHCASPYVLNVQDAQRDLVDPAVRGTLSVLAAAAKSPGIKRVVLTSSMAAVTDEPDGRILTENDWNTRSSLTRNPYYFSKAEAERAAWQFMKDHEPRFDLVVINPFMVIGPSLAPTLNTSNQILLDIANGTYPAIMALEWGFVDVRDVAQAHILAMTAETAKGRYLCAADNRTMRDVARLLRQSPINTDKLARIDLAGPIGTRIMKLAASLQPAGIRSYLKTHLGRRPCFDNSKIRRDLGIEFRNVDTSLQEAAADLVKWGHARA